ncbi:secreted protein [Streptomyces xanthochromogenes]|uniref:hypothetical protein n=1 Tax=Streptomyces xanthochromogenes TaxID=67384 RepID=UPI00199AC404|nr:hypothetical protein [Streptomyces xanthochromogenes]GHB80468.1 secreted protein [Streptomyces xanthochromogenes]
MAISHARKLFLPSALALISTAAIVGAVTVAQAAPAEPQKGAVAAEPPSAVENFDYPNADAILTERGLKLNRGDGGIMLADCTAGSWDIRISAIKDWVASEICFTTLAKTGYLSLEVPGTFNVKALGHPVRATLTSEGRTKVVDSPKDVVTPVGTGDIPGGAKEATLVELRVSD